MIENGILLIDKPAGMSSFGVVARVRRVLSQAQGRRVKVGHTGTLDPFATGLLILVVGQECRNANQYSKLDKVYEAEITLGATSSTGDPEGEIVAVSQKVPSEHQVRATLETFHGEIRQKPPIYSAVKIGGERAYKLARRGEMIEMPERLVTIYQLELLEYSYPTIKIRTHVSSGTYIRTLAADIGQALGVGAYCSQLRRTQIANYSVEAAQQLADLGVDS